MPLTNMANTMEIKIFLRCFKLLIRLMTAGWWFKRGH